MSGAFEENASLDLQSALEKLRGARDTFEHLVKNSPFGIYVIDADFRLVEVSAGAQKVFENVRPLIGRDLAEVLRLIWPEPFASEAIGHFRHTLATGEPYHAPATVELRRDIPETEAYDWKVERIKLPDGQFGAVCHFYDLSERERYQAALRQSEERYRSFVEDQAEEVCRWRPTGVITMANWAFARAIGSEPADVEGMSFLEQFSEDAAAAVVSAVATLNGHNQVVTQTLARDVAGRSQRWIEWSHRLLRSGDLQSSGRDVTDRHTAEVALRRSEERFRTMATTAREGVWAVDAQGRTLFANPRMAELLDVPLDALTASKIFDFIAGKDLDEGRRRVEANLEGRTEEFEFRFQRRDGSQIDVLAATAGLRGDDGQMIGALGGYLDLRERKRAEERQSVLMHEMAHRGKNLLAVIQSIASRSLSGNRTLAEAREVFIGRLHALAATYSRLTNDAFEGAPLEDIVNDEFAPYASRIRVGGPKLMLYAKPAQTFALVLHELATNAAKHGALAVADGTVLVDWRLAETAGDFRFEFEWREHGGPPVQRPQRRGFGATLIEQIASADLNARAVLDYAPEGFRYRLEAPLTAIGRPLEDLAVAQRLRSQILRDFYASWQARREPYQLLPLVERLDRWRFEPSGALTLAEIDGGDVRFLQVGHALTERLGRRVDPAAVVPDKELPTDAYRRCAQRSAPTYETVQYDFGDDDIVTFERLLLPFSRMGGKTTHVAGLVVFTNEAKSATQT